MPLPLSIMGGRWPARFAAAFTMCQIALGVIRPSYLLNSLESMSPPTSQTSSRTLRLAVGYQPTPLIPIGLGAVMRVDFGTPGVISHVRPMILVETGISLEQFLVDVQNEPLFNRVDRKGTPWNGK